MFQIETGKRRGRICSVCYYPPKGHSSGSQIRTAPDCLSSSTTFKVEVDLLCGTEPGGNRWQQYQKLPQQFARSMQVVCASCGGRTLPGLHLNQSWTWQSWAYDEDYNWNIKTDSIAMVPTLATVLLWPVGAEHTAERNKTVPEVLGIRSSQRSHSLSEASSSSKLKAWGVIHCLSVTCDSQSGEQLAKLGEFLLTVCLPQHYGQQQLCVDALPVP